MLLAFSTGVDRPLPTAFPALPARDDQLEEIAALASLVRVVVAAVLAVGRAHADVDDATNETMRRAVEGIGRLRSGEPLRPWLVGIARHVALDARRARGRTARRIASPQDDDETSLVDRASAREPSPFEQLAQARRDERVRRALATLAEGPRQALTLFHLEGLGYDDIATRLGVPMGTVATWISRGRMQLADVLAQEGGIS